MIHNPWNLAPKTKNLYRTSYPHYVLYNVQ